MKDGKESAITLSERFKKLVFLTISFLYYYAPAKRTGFRFISAGSTLATILFILTSLGFSAYVNKFGQYNKLYSSIGTLMVILIWLYLNSNAILIGFELNVSIKVAFNKDTEKAALTGPDPLADFMV